MKLNAATDVAAELPVHARVTEGCQVGIGSESVRHECTRGDHAAPRIYRSVLHRCRCGVQWLDL